MGDEAQSIGRLLGSIAHHALRIVPRRSAPRHLALAAFALALATAARAQPDTTATVRAQPADSLAVPAVVAGDSTEALPPAVPLAPFGRAPGHAVTPVPAVTAALDVGALLAEAPRGGRQPAALGYAVGGPGRMAGVALDGADPHAPALTLDGRPLDDVVTGTPRLDLLPLGVLGPLRVSDGALGRANGLAARTRDYRLGVPVTELRYLGGGSGTRHASGVHAQTRRPPSLLRGGSDLSRITLTGHAANRASDGVFGGAVLRHTDALARALLTVPGLAVEIGGVYADRTVGARRGVVADDSSAAIFDLDGASVLGAGDERRTIRAEGWLRLRVPIIGPPIEAGVSVAEQRLIYDPEAGDTLRVHGRRLAAFVEQPATVGAHRLRLRLDVDARAAPGPDGGALAGRAGGRLGLHVGLSDSVRVGPAALALAVGAHREAGRTWPSGAARVTLGVLSVGVRAGARARSWLAEGGLDTLASADLRFVTAAPDALERTLAADAGLDLRRGPFRVSARLFGDATTDGFQFVALGDTAAAALVAPGVVRQGGLSAEVGWRESARRGVYARLGGTARAVLDPMAALKTRIDAALPRAWGTLRVGARAEDVGQGVLDLDVAVVATGWTAFRSRRVEPATGALLLADPAGGLGVEVPARVVVGAEATASFSARTSLFLRYDNALAERLYNGAFVTQGEPIPPAVFRFGVFWALLN